MLTSPTLCLQNELFKYKTEIFTYLLKPHKDFSLAQEWEWSHLWQAPQTLASCFLFPIPAISFSGWTSVCHVNDLRRKALELWRDWLWPCFLWPVGPSPVLPPVAGNQYIFVCFFFLQIATLVSIRKNENGKIAFPPAPAPVDDLSTLEYNWNKAYFVTKTRMMKWGLLHWSLREIFWLLYAITLNRSNSYFPLPLFLSLLSFFVFTSFLIFSSILHVSFSNNLISLLLYIIWSIFRF